MLNCPVRFVVMTLLAILFIAGQSEAGRSRLSKPSERTFDIRQTRYQVGAKFSTGVVIGEAADAVRKASGGFAEKLIYGFGLLGEYTLKPTMTLGIIAEIGWKTPLDVRDESIRLTSFGGSFSYRFSPGGRSSLYSRIEGGVLMGTYPRDDNDADLGSHPYVRIGIGQVYHTGPVTSAQFELYYKRAFSDGYELEDGPIRVIPGDGECIGLDIYFLVGF